MLMGIGVLQNYKQAAEWFRKAAEQGNTGAQNNLGFMYANGQGVTQNRIEAHKWFNIAGANGFEDARKQRENVEKHMTSSQIAKAQRLASTWTKSHQK